MDLHWLRIPNRITFKILLLVYRAAAGSAPQYLTELLTSTSAIPGRASLRSSNNRTLVVPRSRTVRQGGRPFIPRLWTQDMEFPSNRSPCCADNRTFKKKLLKTYLFSRSSWIQFLNVFVFNHYFLLFTLTHSMIELNCWWCLSYACTSHWDNLCTQNMG